MISKERQKKLYDKTGEPREAKKGDVKEIDGEEHESIGEMESEQERPDLGVRNIDVEEEGFDKMTERKEGRKTRSEFWKKKRRKAYEESPSA